MDEKTSEEESIRAALGRALTPDEGLDLRGASPEEAEERIKGRLVIGGAEGARVLQIRLTGPGEGGVPFFRRAVEILKEAKAEGRIFRATPGRSGEDITLTVEFWGEPAPPSPEE